MMVHKYIPMSLNLFIKLYGSKVYINNKKGISMQTFVPYPHFGFCAVVLDKKRLWKQVVECKQLLKTLKGESNFAYHHPALLMWKQNIESLENYAYTLNKKCLLEGIKSTQKFIYTKDAPFPSWWGDFNIHFSHQSNLVRKKPEYYLPMLKLLNKQFDLFRNIQEIPNDLPYVWPVRINK
jgi:hypothetical protein